MVVDGEQKLSEAYRTTKRMRWPEGQGLDNLYVRFFRMAERCIAEKTGQGVACFISNYSWLDELSFTGMWERYLEAFDAIRIDCLNGDRYKISNDPTCPPNDPFGNRRFVAIFLRGPKPSRCCECGHIQPAEIDMCTACGPMGRADFRYCAAT